MIMQIIYLEINHMNNREKNVLLSKGNKTISLMPEFTRHRVIVEFIPLKNTDKPQYLKVFLCHLAKINNLRVYLGPVVISPETFKKTLITSVKKTIVNTLFSDLVFPVEAHKPKDKNFFLIWEKSHVFGYHYKNGLLAIEISVCSKFDLYQTLKYIHLFFMPVKNTMRYIQIDKSPNCVNSWKSFAIKNEWKSDKSLQIIKNNLMKLINEMDVNNKPKLYQQGWKLHSLLVNAKTSCGGWFIDSLHKKTIVKIQNLYNFWEWLVEERFATSIINKTIIDVDDFPLKHYHAISLAEVKYGKINDKCYVYIIGSGIPITACLIDQYAHPRKIICVEKNLYRANLASMFIKALKKEGTISVVHGKGEQLDYPHATHIIFSALSVPKNVLAKHVDDLYTNKRIDQVKILWRNTEIGNPDDFLFYPALLPVRTVYKSRRIAQYSSNDKDDIISTVVEITVVS